VQRHVGRLNTATPTPDTGMQRRKPKRPSVATTSSGQPWLSSSSGRASVPATAAEQRQAAMRAGPRAPALTPMPGRTCKHGAVGRVGRVEANTQVVLAVGLVDATVHIQIGAAGHANGEFEAGVGVHKVAARRETRARRGVSLARPGKARPGGGVASAHRNLNPRVSRPLKTESISLSFVRSQRLPQLSVPKTMRRGLPSLPTEHAGGGRGPAGAYSSDSSWQCRT
jgi:hypothetical protein